MAEYLKEGSGERLAAGIYGASFLAICAATAVYYSLPDRLAGLGGQSDASIA
jgi:hypothetical protein